MSTRFSASSSSALPPRSPRPLLFIAASALALAPALAQNLATKAPPQSTPVAIINATVHPVSSPPIDNAFILFQDGKITGLGSVGQNPDFTQKQAQGWTVINAQGKHVYPGLIGAVTQMGLIEFDLVRQTNDRAETGDVTPELVAAVAVNPDSNLLPVTRTNGILTVGVFQNGGLIPGQPSAIRLDGWTIEDLPLATPFSGPNKHALGLSVNWPFVRPIQAPWMTRPEDDQIKQIKENLARLAQVFDTAHAYDATRQADAAAPIDLRWEAMRAVFPRSESQPEPQSDQKPRANQLPLFVFANDADQILSAVAFCTERDLRMVLVGGRDAHLCAQALKSRDIPVIITGTHSLPKRNDSAYDEPYTLPKKLLDAGLRFCIASADDTAHERNLPYNAAIAVAHGLPADAALKSITLWPAQILGIADQVGSLDTGKLATLILTDGDPLEITTNTHRAWIDGREIDLTNKQSTLAEKYRERYRQQKPAPAAPTSSSPSKPRP